MKINHDKIHDFIESKTFLRIVTTMIILCSIVLGLETFAKTPFWINFFKWIDIFFTTFFAGEILVRVLAEKPMIKFFVVIKFRKIRRKDNPNNFYVTYNIRETAFWNWFDLLIVVFSIVGMASHFFEHPEFLVIARLFRIFRILRLFEVSEKLKDIEKRIIAVIPTVFSFGLLLLILLYIYSIIGIYLFEFKNYGKANFSNLHNSMITLFQIMTLDGWADVMNDVRNNMKGWHPLVPITYFISFVVLTAIVTFNVFIAVLTSQVEERMIKDMQENEESLKLKIEQERMRTQEEMRTGLIALLNEIAALKSELNEIKEGVKNLK